MTLLRRLPRFEFRGPGSVAEACELLAGGSRQEQMLLAGGTDALLQLRRRERRPRRVIGLKRVADLDYVRARPDGGLEIGALTTLRTLLHDPQVGQHCALLGETAAQIGGIELRNVATIGGNVAGALPCADLVPPLLTLGASIRLVSASGERWLPLEQFFPEFGRTVARDDELVAALAVPAPASHSAGTYLKFHDRQSMDMTVVGVAATVSWDAGRGVFRGVQVALANGAPTVFRARGVDALLVGQPCSDAALAAAAEVVCSEANPRGSWRAARDYRFELIRNLTRRAIRCAWQKAAAAPEGAR